MIQDLASQPTTPEFVIILKGVNPLNAPVLSTHWVNSSNSNPIMLKVAINGFGRIGRVTARILQQHKDVELVAVNDLTDNKTLAHLFKYDSVHGVFKGEVGYDEKQLILGDHKVKAYSEKDPSLLPWKQLDIDVVINAPAISSHANWQPCI